MGLVLVLVTFAVFAPAIQFRFLDYDDGLYVSENRHVLGGLNRSGLEYAFTTIDAGNWMPVTWLSLELDATLYGNWPAGYHFTNILLHCSSVLLLFLALERMTKAFWCSALAVVLFAIHPLRQESVVWLGERKGVLSTFFWMLGLLAYARYTEKRSFLRYAAVALWLVLGLLSKPMLIMFPFGLLLLDFWPLQRCEANFAALRVKFWPLFLEKIPLLLLCGALTAIAFWAQSQTGALSVMPSSILEKILHVLDDYMIYLRHIFWPVQLAIPYPMETISWTRAVLSGCLAIGVSTVAVYSARSLPWLTTGWFWFLVTFVPVIGLVQLSHTFVADRYSYVPFIGVAVIIAWGMDSLAKKFPASQKIVIFASLGLCFVAAAVNCATLSRWKDSVSLFSDSIKKGLHPVACNNLAVALNSQGDYSEALRYADLAIQLQSRYPEPGAFITRGISHEGLGDYDKAIEDYTTALNLDPRSSLAHQNRGNTYVEKGDLNAALADFSRSIKLNPDSAAVWNSRAFVWCSLSNFDAALSDCARAVQLNAQDANVYITRGNVFSRMGNFRDAVADYSMAITLNSNFVIAYNNRAAAYLGLKELDKVQADIQSCERLGGRPSPNVVEGLSNALTAEVIQSRSPKAK
jgi:tetratricopeptide (TPR) repeat protein